MTSIIELRKQELTGQINQMMVGIEDTIRTYSQYVRLKNDLESARRTLDRIKEGFEPQSDRPETFHRVLEELKELGRDVEEIRERGEAEKRRLQRNAASARYAGPWAGILAALGGIVLGYGGCSSCMEHNAGGPGPFPNGLPWFNTITGLLIGVIGGAAMGALIGALSGQMRERESGDSASGLWLSIGGIAILILFGLWMLILNTDNRPMDPTGRFVIISECYTPCRMEVEDYPDQYFNTDQKLVLVKYNGKKEWIRYGAPGSSGVSRDEFNPGMAEFISPENAPSVRVQLLRKR